ncbi:histone-like nucleoid-structuring protein Lsr2 [Streptomyces sp. ISL-100]|uniref:Lsr2 family DNA-binding protein n=1 Tax=Streptomyces sp. ISL-100 TaxID=2819173 RepID=UPI001BEC2AF3|nr:histone-like nucleoid-structuring protein Lsr2 [Streptomyces sp. ISL-100]MBT2401063.1 Lsr2 family protein [Streptomyces sp. ISL-100]
MRTTVQVISYVEKVVCDGCLSKDGTQTEATDTLNLGERSWDLCLEHSVRFSRYLVDALGAGLPSDALEAEPVESVPESVTVEPETDVQGDAPAVEETEEPTAEADLADYVSRIRDNRKARNGKPLDANSQAARAQWSKHRERLAALPEKERADYVKWCAAEGKDARLSASHVEFRGFMWSNFPHMARAYADAMRGTSQQQEQTAPAEPVTPDACHLSDRERNKAVRQWARENGFDVPARGRIPMAVSQAYRLAHESRESADAKESHTAA